MTKTVVAVAETFNRKEMLREMKSWKFHGHMGFHDLALLLKKKIVRP